MKRRDFVKVSLGLGALALLSPWEAAAAAAPFPRGRMLVAVHLFGGNDGLNTVVPWDHPAYKKQRPSLALQRDQTAAARGLGFHASLAPLLPLWERGHMAVVNGVGYDSPSHSHFRSSEIWHTGCVQGARDEGWLGRYLDRSDTVGVNVEATLTQALWSKTKQPVCVRERGQLNFEQQDAAYLQALDALYRGSSAAHLRRTYGRLRQTMQELQDAPPSPLTLPQDEFGKNLDSLLRVMPHGGVYHTSMSGFDTHGAQHDRHAKALGSLANGLSAFWQALEHRGLADNTLILVYSEFGRRVEENASAGTDHGTAGPLFLIGKHVNRGFHGEYPTLTRLDDGDLRHTVDFRSVYATILERWLHTDSRPILEKTYPQMALLR